jgi:hypothetical protein
MAMTAPPSGKTATDMASATPKAICHGAAPIAEIRRSPTPTPRPTPKINSIGRRSR